MSRLSAFIRTLARRGQRKTLGPIGPTSNRKPTLLLHLGPHKTGSTAIQLFCERNREQLARAGFWYPSVGITGGQHLVLPGCYFSHHPHISDSLLGGSPEQIVAAIGAETPPGLIPLLSSEVFWELLRDQPKDFQAALAVLDQRYRVHIVMVERQNDERLWSGIKHDVRAGFACDPAELFGKSQEHHLQIVARLLELGCPLIHVAYDAADCVSRFLESLSSQLGPVQFKHRLKLKALVQKCREDSKNLRENVAPSAPWFAAFTLELSRRRWVITRPNKEYDSRIASLLHAVSNLGDAIEAVCQLPDDDAMFRRVVHANSSPGCLLSPEEIRAWESICEHPAVQLAARNAGCADELRAVSRATSHCQRAAA